MTKKKADDARKRRRPRRQVVLVFGEDESDTKAIAELIVAICPELAGKVKPLSRPPILIKDARPGDVVGRASVISALIEGEKAVADVICVFAHEDCDAVEPAHEGLAMKIEESMASAGHHVHAVTPAWEIEAWWLMWPDALVAYRSSWRKITKYRERNVGVVENAKEALRRELRPTRGSGESRARDYRETDSPGIAKTIREGGYIASTQAKSASYDRFVESVTSCCRRV